MDNASTEAPETVPVPTLKRPAWATESISTGTSRTKPITEGMAWKRQMYREHINDKTVISVAIMQHYDLRLDEVEEPYATFGKPHIYIDADDTLHDEELTAEQVEYLAYGLLEAAATLRQVTK